jgi:hypothetical protein
MNIVLRILGGLIVLYTGLNLFIATGGTWGLVRNAMAEFDHQRTVLGSEAAPVEKGERLALWRYVLSIPPVRNFFGLWLPAFFLGLAMVVWG